MKMNLDKNDIRTKTFNILKDDKVIKTFINPPDTFKWDGKDNNGKIADPEYIILQLVL